MVSCAVGRRSPDAHPRFSWRCLWVSLSLCSLASARHWAARAQRGGQLAGCALVVVVWGLLSSLCLFATAFSRPYSALLSSSLAGDILLHPIQVGNGHHRVCTNACDGIGALVLRPKEAAHVVSAGEDGSVCVWDVSRASAASSSEVCTPLVRVADAHMGPAVDVAVCESHPLLAVSAGLDGKCVVSDLRAKVHSCSEKVCPLFKVFFARKLQPPSMPKARFTAWLAIPKAWFWASIRVSFERTTGVWAKHSQNCAWAPRSMLSRRSLLPQCPLPRPRPLRSEQCWWRRCRPRICSPLNLQIPTISRRWPTSWNRLLRARRSTHTSTCCRQCAPAAKVPSKGSRHCLRLRLRPWASHFRSTVLRRRQRHPLWQYVRWPLQ